MIRALYLVFVVAVKSRSIQETMDEYCSVNKKLEHASTDDYSGYVKYMTKLFEPKFSCSFDPFDKMIGYDLKDATLEECLDADSKGWEGFFGGKKVVGDSFHCIETIADEKKGLGSIWGESTFSVGDDKPITVGVAYRFSFNKEGLIKSQHYIGDMAPALMKYGSPKTMLVSTPQVDSWPGVMSFLCGVALASLSFAAVTMAKMKARTSSELAGYQDLNA